ncbi:MAG TPA: DUF3010 family protein [Victivallales bacterium]|nr:DUF3010 family protein [Victivallales bacterium]
MTVCGIEMSGSEARLVILEGKKTSFKHIDIEPRKIKLINDEIPDEVKEFRNAIFTFLKKNKISLVTIKKRGKKGDYSGGPVGFKLEGIVQLYEECQVILTSPQTISAAQKKYSPAKPENLRKYQYTAFETAFSVLT